MTMNALGARKKEWQTKCDDYDNSLNHESTSGKIVELLAIPRCPCVIGSQRARHLPSIPAQGTFANIRTKQTENHFVQVS